MTGSNQKNSRFIRSEQVEAKGWSLPDVDDEQLSESETAVLYIPDPATDVNIDDELPTPPTLEEIEQITDDAYQEGFTQGKQDGYAKGLEEGRLAGAEQGHKTGFEQGLEQGLSQGEADIKQRLAQLDTLLVELVNPLEALDESVERELVGLAMRLAEAVVQVELKTSSNAILEALRQAIHALPSRQQNVVIHVCQQDLDVLAKAYGDEELARRQWQLRLEPTLAVGSLRVETERSDVEMISEARLHQVLAAFTQKPREPVGEPSYPKPDLSQQQAPVNSQPLQQPSENDTSDGSTLSAANGADAEGDIAELTESTAQEAVQQAQLHQQSQQELSQQQLQQQSVQQLGHELNPTEGSDESEPSRLSSSPNQVSSQISPPPDETA